MYQELTPADVAKIADCHRNTVVRYTEKGVIAASRDHNGFRRYDLNEALKLRQLLRRRTPEQVLPV